MSTNTSLLLLLLLLEVLLFLSPFVFASREIVTSLPGFDGPLPFHLETGYLSVDEVEFFYYFIESERNPRKDPLMLWLTGGPGCSAFSGLVFEIGPLRFVNKKYNGSLPSLLYNPYAWTKVANIIFLDSPVGTGFSFATSPKAYEVDDTKSSLQIYKALLKWYSEHPNFLSNPLYIAGDSFGGKVVPIVTDFVAKGNIGRRRFHNLKGYLVGNPTTGELVDTNSRIPYLYGVGIIPKELFKEIEVHCAGEDYSSPDPRNFLCYNAVDKYEKIHSEIMEAHVLEPKCLVASPKPRFVDIYRRSLEDILIAPDEPDITCGNYGYYLSYFWANDNATREALHVKEGSVPEWVRCNHSLSYTKNVASSIEYHLNLTRKGYRSLVYSGDQDSVIPHVGTEEWIRSLGFPIVDDWRSWHVDGQVAGYTRKYDNDLTYATVKNAGHTAPEYQPKNCLAMLDRWLSYSKL